jgi:hypothetical protein
MGPGTVAGEMYIARLIEAITGYGDFSLAVIVTHLELSEADWLRRIYRQTPTSTSTSGSRRTP